MSFWEWFGAQCCGKSRKRDTQVRMLKRTQTRCLFQEPARPMLIAGGTSSFYQLDSAGGGVAACEDSGAPKDGWIGKDLGHAFDELAFYEAAQAVRDDKKWRLVNFFLRFGGSLEDFPVAQDDGSEAHIDLIVLESLVYGRRAPRLIDIKVGEHTAAANWKGKSKFASWRQKVLDSHTNSALEGVRLEGFLNPPAFIRSEEDPAVDLGGGGWKICKKTRRMIYQRMHMSEVWQAFIDLRCIGGDEAGNSNQRLLPAEFSEVTLLSSIAQLADILHECQEVPVPQKWIGSSICAIVESGVAPERTESQCSRAARLCLLDWGRSELSTEKDHEAFSEEERQDRARFWDMYLRGVVKMTWEATRLYWSSFCVQKWERLRVSVYDFNFAKANMFLGAAEVKLPEGVSGADVQALNLELRSAQGAQIRGYDGQVAKIDLRAAFHTYPKPSRFRGAWRVQVVRAQHLPAGDHGMSSSSSDPFAVVTLYEDDTSAAIGNNAGPPRIIEGRTSVAPRTLEPVWQESLEFPVTHTANSSSATGHTLGVAGVHALETALLPPAKRQKTRCDKAVMRIRFAREERPDLQVSEKASFHSWMVRLKRDKDGGGGLGFDFDPATLEVTEVKAEGALASWNKRNPVSSVQVGDHIAEVNCKGVMKHGVELTSLELTQRNHHDIWMRVVRDGMGCVLVTLDLAEDEANHASFLGPPKSPGMVIDEQTMCVKAINAAGMIAEWNDAFPEQAVHPGDRIVEVNGKHVSQVGVAEVLAELDKKKGEATSLIAFIAKSAQAVAEEEFAQDFFHKSDK